MKFNFPICLKLKLKIRYHLQRHNDVSKQIDAQYARDVAKKRGANVEKTNDIKELIVQLVAKENLPLRIVESKHFTKLLQGKFVQILKFMF